MGYSKNDLILNDMKIFVLILVYTQIKKIINDILKFCWEQSSMHRRSDKMLDNKNETFKQNPFSPCDMDYHFAKSI